MVKAFSEVTDAKIMAVGDDWQSIYERSYGAIKARLIKHGLIENV